MMNKAPQLLLYMLSLGLALPASPQNTIAITGARIETVTHGTIANGTVVIENGKIEAVGPNVPVPGNAKRIDATGKIIIPGLFDAGDQLGLIEIPAVRITDDSTEYTDPIHPELRVIDAFNPESENIRVARAAGITNALVEPSGGNLVAGQSAVIALDGEASSWLVKSPASLQIHLGEQSKETYGSKDRTPGTRMGEIALLRQAFLHAQHDLETRHGTSNAQSGRELKMEALELALNGAIPVVVHANRLSDLEAAIRLGDEFHLRLVLADAASAWRIADKIAAKKIPVIVTPAFQPPSRMEAADARPDNIAILARSGVLVGMESASTYGVRDLWFAAGYAMANGLTGEQALEALTLNPARLFHVEDQLGSIDVGKDATLLILDGEPFRVETHVVSEFIHGRSVDLSNHQTRLYEEYKAKYGIP
jgi:imidazolonepropionase-like amidohydrolase